MLSKSKVLVSFFLAGILMVNTMPCTMASAQSVHKSEVSSIVASSKKEIKAQLSKKELTKFNCPKVDWLQKLKEYKKNNDVKNYLTVAPSDSTSNGVLPLNDNGVETGAITTAKSYVTYGATAESDEDFDAYLQFSGSENSILEVAVVDASTSNVISKSISDFANSEYQTTRIRASKGNVVLFLIVDESTSTPNYNYSLNVAAVSNVTDSNEPNNNILESANYPTQSFNTAINANFDNPYDIDCYKITTKLSSFINVNFTATGNNASDIQYLLYQEDSSGNLNFITSGDGSIPQFTGLAYTTYIIEVVSSTSANYDYSLNFVTSPNGTVDKYEFPDPSLDSPYFLNLPMEPDGHGGITYDLSFFGGTIYNPYSKTNPYTDEDNYGFELYRGVPMEFYLKYPSDLPLDMSVYRKVGSGEPVLIGTATSGTNYDTKVFSFTVPTDFDDSEIIVSITPSAGDILSSTTANESYELTVGTQAEVNAYHKYY